VLTQFSIMVAMRSPAKLDRDAIGGWVEEQEVSAELLRDLPSLKNGQAWLWSPHALERAEKVMFRRRDTFDSGATPKVGQATRKPKTIADVDLGAIEIAMKETVERSKENDPVELKRKVKDLQRQLDERPAAAPEIRYEYIVHGGSVDALRSIADLVTEFGNELAERRDDLVTQLALAEGAPPTPRALDVVRERAVPTSAKTQVTESINRDVSRNRGKNRGVAAEVSGAPAKILQVIAQQNERGVDITPRRAGFLAGYSSRKSTVRNAMSTLRQAGYIEDHDGHVIITLAGIEAVGPIEPLPTGEELKAHWLQEIGPTSAPGRILWQMMDVDHGHKWTNSDLAECAGVDPGTSTLRNAMSKLRQLGLVTGNSLDPDFVEAIR
jgi:hypothetical protein